MKLSGIVAGIHETVMQVLKCHIHDCSRYTCMKLSGIGHIHDL